MTPPAKQRFPSPRARSQPSRSAVGLVRAVLLGLRLVADNQDLQAAIRRELKKAIGPREERRQARARGLKLDHLIERRRKLWSSTTRIG